MCTGHVRATGRPMGMRVLGSRKWSRPGRVGAGCDARVLGLHAAHVRGCTKVHERSAVPRSGHRVVAKRSRTGDYRPDSGLIG